jgi:glycosyltransferase involved in cell wall biosynthesis
MKILIVTGIFPPDIGGPASYVPAMARALAERGHEIRVLTTSEPEHLNHDDRVYPFPVTRLSRRLPISRRSPWYVAQVRECARQAEVVYGNGIHLETALACRLAHRPLVMKIVGDEAWERATRKGWTQHNFDEFQQRRQKPRVECLKRVRSFYSCTANQLIVPSQYLKRVTTDWGVASDRIRVVYNAVEQSGVLPEASRAASPASSSPCTVRLLTVGRLVPWKGIDLLIGALTRVPQASLTVVGEGPCRSEWEDLAQRKGVGSRVDFRGPLSRAALAEIMADHDVFALASTYEGLPHVIVEALGAGLPVVATGVGGTPEVVQHNVNGLLVEPEETSLAMALGQMVHDAALRKRMAAASTASIQAKFQSSTMVTQTEAAILQFANTRRGETSCV